MYPNPLTAAIPLQVITSVWPDVRTGELAVCWDIDTGWAHVAAHRRFARPIRLGFAVLPDPDPTAVAAALLAEGFRVVAGPIVREAWLAEVWVRYAPTGALR